MKLKYVYLTEKPHINHVGKRIFESTSYHLYRKDDDMEIVEFCSYEQEMMKNSKHLSANTLLAYRTGVIRFIDYLFGAGVMGADSQASLHHIYNVIYGYPKYLTKNLNSNYVGDEIDVGITGFDEIDAIIELMDEYKPCLVNSSANQHLVAVTHYLGISERRAAALHTKTCREAGISPADEDYQPIFDGIWGSSQISYRAKLAWQEATLLGGILGAYNHQGIRAKIFERLPEVDADIKNKHTMSQAQIVELLNLPSLSLRDKLLYSFVHASGLRISEALLLQFRHIDMLRRRIFMKEEIDMRGLTLEERKLCKAWKGRHTDNDEVFLFGDAEDIFWKTLNTYLIQGVNNYTHDFIFTFLQGSRKGRPLLLVNMAKINKRSLGNLENRYKAAQKEIGMNESEVYGFQMARHILVNFLLYDILRLVVQPDGSEILVSGTRVQTVRALIGHESIMSTKHYTRDKGDEVKAEYQAARKRLRFNAQGEQMKLIELETYYLMQAAKLNKQIRLLGLSDAI